MTMGRGLRIRLEPRRHDRLECLRHRKNPVIRPARPGNGQTDGGVVALVAGQTQRAAVEEVQKRSVPQQRPIEGHVVGSASKAENGGAIIFTVG